MQGNQRALIWVGVVALVVGGILIATWKPMGQGAPVGSTGPAPVFAPQGELTPQFPKELILDKSASISRSYALNYSSSTNQYTAEWNSSISAGTLVSNYNAFFKANSWTATTKQTAYPTVHGISAIGANGSASVVIVDQGKTSQVVVTYVPNAAQ